MKNAVKFKTNSLVEAALMWLRVGRVERCEWNDRNMCIFHFEGTDEDVAFARNVNSQVSAREFNQALVSVKTEMYASKDG